jgi:hypothetical protein
MKINNAKQPYKCIHEFRDFDRDIVAERVKSNAKTGNCDSRSSERGKIDNL